MHDIAQPRRNSSLLRRRAPPHDQRKTQCRMMQPRTDVRWHMQSAHGMTLAAAPQKPRRTSQFSSHPRGRGGASAACAPELRRGRAASPAQCAAESSAFSRALRQRGTRQSATARSRSSRRQCALPTWRRAAQPRSVSRTVMRRVTPVKGGASHRAAYRAPEQAPQASAAHPDDTPPRVPCAACSATALQSAHRPRAAPRRSVPTRAAQRASCLSGAPRLPSRRPASGNESGSFAACRRARCVLQAAPPPTPPCSRPAARVRSENALGRPVASVGREARERTAAERQRHTTLVSCARR
jgi:hypothetical protein